MRDLPLRVDPLLIEHLCLVELRHFVVPGIHQLQQTGSVDTERARTRLQRMTATGACAKGNRNRGVDGRELGAMHLHVTEIALKTQIYWYHHKGININK